MSFSFTIPSSRPTLELIQKAGANYRNFTQANEEGFLVWRGKSSRGIPIFSGERGQTSIRIPALASDDDLQLAKELAVSHAQFFQVPVGLEDWPDESFFSLGLEADFPSCPPNIDLIRKANANYRVFDHPKAKGFFVWRGDACRGVHLFHDGKGKTCVRIVNPYSQDDQKLAAELLGSHAQFTQEQGAQQALPSAGEAEADESKGVFVPVDLVQGWHKDWHMGWRKSEMESLMVLLNKEGIGNSLALFSGPNRQTFVGKAMLVKASRVAGGAEKSLELAAALINSLIQIQELGEWPVKTLFNNLTVLEEKPVGFFQKLLGKSGLKIQKDAPWCPPAATLHSPVSGAADIGLFKRVDAVGSEPSSVLASPGGKYLLPYADYVGIREESGSWFLLPFGTFFRSTE